VTQTGGRRGFQPPQKVNKIIAGFSPGGTLSANVTQNPKFSAACSAPEEISANAAEGNWRYTGPCRKAKGYSRGKRIKMNLNLISFLILLAFAVAVPTILFLLLRSSLCDLLRHTLKLQAGVTFYLRSFLLVLYLAALSGAIGISFDLKPESRFMEYVWKEASGVSSSLQNLVLFISVYLILITILIATLKVNVDE
jgi:hypothetical protein